MSSILKKYIGMISLVLSLLQLNGQSTTVLVSNSKENPGEEINIKWIANGLIFEEGVNVYRREENTPLWIKLNREPIRNGEHKLPDEAFRKDSSLQSYIDMMIDTKSSDIQGMAEALILLKSVYSNDFARYIGIQYDDTTGVPGSTYRYMVKRVSGEKEIFEAVSEPVTQGPFVASPSPKEVKVEARSKKVNIWWKVENERFHSVNIYRRAEGSSVTELITDKPVVLATRIGPDGKEAYPDVYFMDKKVENGLTYFYQLAGIDFFGRETKWSAEIKVMPVNKTPPPAPDYLDSKVNLLKVNLEWQANDMKGVEGYHIYRTSSIYKPYVRITKSLLAPVTVRYTDEVDEPGYYYYYVASVDKNGNEGRSNKTMAEVLDIYPPPVPQNLKAESDSGTITLTWNSVEDKHLAGYRLYRTVDADKREFYALVNAYPVEDTVYVDSLPFNARNPFYYSVVSVDTALNMSEFSTPASATLPDVVPPDVPFIKEIKEIDGALDITWLPNLDVDLMGYYLFREEMKDSVPFIARLNNQPIGAKKTSYVDLTISKDVEYKYYLKAIDSVGNQSYPSNKYPAMVEAKKSNVPAKLKNISVKYSPVNKQVTLKWQSQSENSMKGTVVFRKETGAKSFLPVSGLIKGKEYKEKITVGTKYIYRLTAYSNSGTKWTSEEFVIETNDK